MGLGTGRRCDVCFAKGSSLKTIFLVVIIPDENVFSFKNAMGNAKSGFLTDMTVTLCFGTIDSILRGNMRLPVLMSCSLEA